jgi:hypothetical protein
MIDHSEAYGDALLADGFEGALIGFGFHFNAAVAHRVFERLTDKPILESHRPQGTVGSAVVAGDVDRHFANTQ